MRTVSRVKGVAPTRRVSQRRGKPLLVMGTAQAVALAVHAARPACATPATPGGPDSGTTGTFTFPSASPHSAPPRSQAARWGTGPDERVPVEARGHRTPGGERLRFQEGGTVHVG